jgi:2-methylisocitrate lyase-like PEP mutase family enzyme
VRRPRERCRIGIEQLRTFASAARPRVPVVFSIASGDGYTVSGNDEAIAARLDGVLAAGADGFVLVFAGEVGGIAEMRRFASELRPRLGGTSPR